jgi:stringent starvation protein B
MAELPSRVPYLLRACHEWLVDAGCTPQLLVDATVPGVKVPAPHVKDGRIVLNVSPDAVRDLRLDNEWIEFNARFGGAPQRIRLPVKSVLAIYARENGEGMAFGAMEGEASGAASAAPASDATAAQQSTEPAPKPTRPSLKLVK